MVRQCDIVSGGHLYFQPSIPSVGFFAPKDLSLFTFTPQLLKSDFIALIYLLRWPPGVTVKTTCLFVLLSSLLFSWRQKKNQLSG